MRVQSFQESLENLENREILGLVLVLGFPKSRGAVAGRQRSPLRSGVPQIHAVWPLLVVHALPCDLGLCPKSRVAAVGWLSTLSLAICSYAPNLGWSLRSRVVV